MKKYLFFSLIVLGGLLLAGVLRNKVATALKRKHAEEARWADSLAALELTKKSVATWDAAPMATVTIDTLREIDDNERNGEGLFFIPRHLSQAEGGQLNMFEICLNNGPFFTPFIQAFCQKGYSYTNYFVARSIDGHYSIVTARHVTEIDGQVFFPHGWKFSDKQVDVMISDFSGESNTNIASFSRRDINPGKDRLEIMGYTLSSDGVYVLRFHIQGIACTIPSALIPIINVRKESKFSNLRNALFMKIPFSVSQNIQQLAGSGVYYVDDEGHRTDTLAGSTAFEVQEKYFKDGGVQLRNIGIVLEQLH